MVAAAGGKPFLPGGSGASGAGAAPSAPPTITAAAAAAKEKPPAYTPPPEGARLITMKEIEEHDSEDDTWILVKDKVYDCNAYIQVRWCKLKSVYWFSHDELESRHRLLSKS